MTTFKRGCVILIIIWTSACGGENTTTTSPSTSTLSSASSTTPGGPALTTLHARIARAIHVEDGAIITFHIQDDRGAPIAGALLQATSTDVGPWQGLADGAGNFIASLFAGRYNLTVSAAGFDTRTLPANLALTGTVTIGLARGNGGPIPPPSDPIPGRFLLTGGVTDGTSGGILPNITLTLSGGAAATTTTDGNGNYQFGNLTAGSYTVSASPTGYVPNSQNISVAGNTVLNLVLQRSISSPPALNATFVVQSTAKAPKADTCEVTAGQLVKCNFDASGSAPASLLTSYLFSINETKESFPVSTSPKLPEPTLPTCGLFSIIKDSNGVFPVTMTVTVTSSDGRTAVSQRKTVSFLKNGAC